MIVISFERESCEEHTFNAHSTKKEYFYASYTCLPADRLIKLTAKPIHHVHPGN